MSDYSQSMALVAVGAVFLDAMLGEPRSWHPLVDFGRLAARIESRLNMSDRSTKRARWHGAIGTVLVILPWVLTAELLAQVPLLGMPLEIAILYLAIGQRSLGEHARRVAKALGDGDLAEARRRVGYIVSRDTAKMQPPDVARAATESVLENGNDAVFGALFWFAVAGAPGVVLYRLVNTLDAMWGYRTPRYLHFGWAAARLDDLMNYIPARLTAFTYALLGNGGTAWRCWRTQGSTWESPNAGPVMAAGAGALQVQLGGPADYHGAVKSRSVLGEGSAPTARDIDRAVGLIRRGVALWLILLMVGEFWIA